MTGFSWDWNFAWEIAPYLLEGLKVTVAATFCGIVGILIYNSVTHHAVDFALSYKRVGLPVGLVVLSVSLSYLGMLWVRRKIRRD